MPTNARNEAYGAILGHLWAVVTLCAPYLIVYIKVSNLSLRGSAGPTLLIYWVSAPSLSYPCPNLPNKCRINCQVISQLNSAYMFQNLSRCTWQINEKICGMNGSDLLNKCCMNCQEGMYQKCSINAQGMSQDFPSRMGQGLDSDGAHVSSTQNEIIK
jgi:hypothetical protein